MECRARSKRPKLSEGLKRRRWELSDVAAVAVIAVFAYERAHTVTHRHKHTPPVGLTVAVFNPLFLCICQWLHTQGFNRGSTWSRTHHLYYFVELLHKWRSVFERTEGNKWRSMFERTEGNKGTEMYPSLISALRTSAQAHTRGEKLKKLHCIPSSKVLAVVGSYSGRFICF
jgi:hypothetical protein